MTYNPSKQMRIIKSIPRLFDILILVIAAYLFPVSIDFTKMFIIYAILLWKLIAYFTNIYFWVSYMRLVVIFFRLGVHFLSFIVGLFAYIGIFKMPDLSREQLVHYFLFSALVIFIIHLLWFLIMVRYNRLINRRPLPTLLIGNTPKIFELKAVLADRTDFEFRVDHHLKIKTMKSVIAQIDPKRTRVIFCSLKEFSEQEIVALQKFTHNHFIDLKFLADLDIVFNQATIQEYIDYLPIISIRETPLERESNRYVKRMLDILVSLLVILFVLSWLYPILWILIRVTSKGPAIFSQKRNGLNNQVFHCFKFRSMRHNNSTSQATQEDDRITPIGKFIRKKSIDELPQFFNVLLGDMSVVGPRPHMEAHNQKFAEKTGTFAFRHMVKPGITGLAQTKGYRGEIKSDEDIVNRVKYDIFYIKNWSFLLDVKIIFQTVWLMVFGDKKAY